MGCQTQPGLFVFRGKCHLTLSGHCSEHVLSFLLVFVRIPEQEEVYSLLKQDGLCLESHGTDSLGLAECKTTPSIPASQVKL